jgi:hypothetical protein
MHFPDQFVVKYKNLDDFTFPILKNVCQPRGSDKTWEFFIATCPKCNLRLNEEGLVISAGRIVSGLSRPASGCPNCGSTTLVATIKGLTDEDKERLRKDKFFSKILSAQSAGGSNSESNCFIATACYGSQDCPEIEVLRKFRDQFLAAKAIGSVMVRLYYAYSPPIASFLSRRVQLRTVIRTSILTPIVRLVHRRLGCRKLY